MAEVRREGVAASRSAIVPVEGKKSSRGTGRSRAVGVLVPMAISVRHVHLSQNSLNQLFGPGHVLHIRTLLSQPGQYAAEETVSLVGPRGRLAHVRVVGPPRAEDQVELSRTDEIELGVDAPLRESGDLANTPGVVLEGPEGSVQLKHGVICPLRHIHMSPADADVLGLKNHDRVSVVVAAGDRRLTFGDIVVRVSPAFILELHVDSDEGNATGLPSGADVLLAEIGST
jgi:acetate kinase